MKIRSALLATVVALVPAIASAQHAPITATAVDKAKDKVTVAEAVEVQGAVTAIDKKNRLLTIKGGDGNVITMPAGAEVKNFNRIKLGDMVTLSYIAALGLELKKGGGRLRERIESKDAVAAQPGDKPAAAAGRKLTIIADVTSVDAAAGTITLRGPERSVDLVVKDKELLTDVRAGDQIAATYTEAIAVAVTPVPPPAPAPAVTPAPALQ